MKRTAVPILSCMLMGFSMQACHDNRSDRLIVDPNGFVHMDKNRQSMENAPIVRLGVGDSIKQVISKNPAFASVITKNAVDEMRLALETTSRLQYDDGDLKLDVCAHSASADGSQQYKDGVAFIGLKLCDSTVDDYSKALQIAQQLVDDLTKSNPGIVDLRTFYMSADQAALSKMGGKLWQDVERKRHVHDSYEKLDTFTEAEARFKDNLANPVLDDDGRPYGTASLLGIYAGKRAIVEIGVSSQQLYGDSPALSESQRRALSYTVSMHFRMRADFDTALLKE